jgi:hypothetical protein
MPPPTITLYSTPSRNCRVLVLHSPGRMHVADPSIDMDAETRALLTTLEAMARRLNGAFVPDLEKVRAFSEAEAKRRARLARARQTAATAQAGTPQAGTI